MRYYLLTAGILFTTLLHAQFGFYAEGGGNYTTIHASRSAGIVKGTGAFGGQAGMGVEYHMQGDYFFYFGTDISVQSFKKDSASTDHHSAISKYTYNPLLVNVPFGMAYQFNLTKTVGLKVYGGINTQIGVGGKVKISSSYTDTSISGNRTSYNKHNIHYGRSINVQSEFQSDLNNTIWGLNIGAGLNINKSVEVMLMYQEGLTNILPGGDGAPEVDKLRSVTLNLKFYFPKNYYTAKQKL